MAWCSDHTHRGAPSLPTQPCIESGNSLKTGLHQQSSGKLVPGRERSPVGPAGGRGSGQAGLAAHHRVRPPLTGWVWPGASRQPGGEMRMPNRDSLSVQGPSAGGRMSGLQPAGQGGSIINVCCYKPLTHWSLVTQQWKTNTLDNLTISTNKAAWMAPLFITSI